MLQGAFDMPDEQWIRRSIQRWPTTPPGPRIEQYVQREHLARSGWQHRFRPQAFAVVVLRHSQQVITRQGDGSGRAQLTVDLTNEQYGIFSSLGKKFVSTHLSGAGTPSGGGPDPVHGLLMNTDHTAPGIRRFGGPDRPMRWSSAGALPIARWRGDEWFVLTFRGINPVGWNLFNGGSESSAEWTDLAGLGFRELCEELIIVDRPPIDEDGLPQPGVAHRPLQLNILGGDPSTYRRLSSSRFVRDHHELRSRQDDLAIQEAGHDHRVEVNTVPTQFSVRVIDNGPYRAIDSIQSNLIISVNPIESGIECITAYRFDLRDDDYLIFGEVLEDLDTLAREPIMLLKREYLESLFWQNGGSLGADVDGWERKTLPGIPAGQHQMLDPTGVRIPAAHTAGTSLPCPAPRQEAPRPSASSSRHPVSRRRPDRRQRAPTIWADSGAGAAATPGVECKYTSLVVLPLGRGRWT